MRFQHSAAGLATLLATSAQAHTLLTTVFVNDVNMGDSNFIRFPRNIDLGKATYPIEDLTSTDMACGRSGDTPAAYTMPITAGNKLTFEFRGDPDGAQPGGKGIEAGHKGSAAVYLKQVASPSDKASGGGWFKLWEEGHDDKAGKWGTDKFRDANGLLSVSLPASLPSGYYLARAELLALQDVQQGGAQFFIGCAQLFVSGSASGSLQIPTGFEAQIPGYVKKGDPAVSFVLEQSRFPYKTAGPAPWTPPASSGGGAVSTTNNVVLKQDEGLVPDNCILQAGGFCGLEPAPYSSAAGRDKAAAECTRGVDACNKQNLPTGDKNCAVWEKYCASIQRGGTTGPPNAGKKLTPSNIDVPGPIPPAVNGGGSSSTTPATGNSAPASNGQSAGSTAAATPAPGAGASPAKSDTGAAVPSPAEAGKPAAASNKPGAAAAAAAGKPADKPASQPSSQPAASPGQGDGAKAGGQTPAAPQIPAPTGGFSANHPAVDSDDCDEDETQGAKSIQGGDQEDGEDDEDADDEDDENDEGGDEDGDDEDEDEEGGKGRQGGAGKYKGDQRKSLTSKGEEATPAGKPTLNVGEKDDEEDGADAEDEGDEEDGEEDEDETDDEDDEDGEDDDEEEGLRGGKMGGFPFGGNQGGAGKGAAGPGYPTGKPNKAAPGPGYPTGKPNKAARAVALVGRGEACGGGPAQACESSCCGAHGVCGSTKLHCGQGCQSLFGLCA